MIRTSATCTVYSSKQVRHCEIGHLVPTVDIATITISVSFFSTCICVGKSFRHLTHQQRNLASFIYSTK
ncbi:uncharacterized protein PHALS_14557 [Plasmopara halstedii]|uniref:Uncharacterized protein n=1 Tax=Plasmopara halstedii TaxID=4781 RepID=A0A0P1AM27_PLAHL|nr:uncharacterized protein PHALS_14557 [Plasmopara halstedii]CEG41702.1 hypothetical protein PHALS_14557 [Plasmopara halstedii]|eukprot:XP_024578071.1 hypothetical protein PHALS_14557 [Plasmopara halstedii]